MNVGGRESSTEIDHRSAHGSEYRRGLVSWLAGELLRTGDRELVVL
jgi:hypothetical protein